MASPPTPSHPSLWRHSLDILKLSIDNLLSPSTTYIEDTNLHTSCLPALGINLSRIPKPWIAESINYAIIKASSEAGMPPGDALRELLEGRAWRCAVFKEVGGYKGSGSWDGWMGECGREDLVRVLEGPMGALEARAMGVERGGEVDGEGGAGLWEGRGRAGGRGG